MLNIFCMTSYFTYAKECMVYPGEYTPMPEIEALLGESIIHSRASAKPLVNMDELTDCFKFKVALPGVKREDIFIHACNNILSVAVLHKDCKKLKEQLQIHEFETECFGRNIVLPENADTEFASAEYKEGILNLIIPKAYKHGMNTLQQIMVY